MAFVDSAKTENVSWTQGLNLNHPHLEKAFKKAPTTLIAALTCPLVPAHSFQTAADATTIFLIFDEVSDKLNESAVAELYEIIKDVFENPDKPRPAGESFIGMLHQNFWNRSRQGATQTFLKYFPMRYLEYVKSTSIQARHRDEALVPDLASYMDLRRKTVGGMPSFGVTLHSLNIPDDMLRGSKTTELELLAQDLLILANDICSYNVEQSRGDSNNAVAVVIYHQDISIQDAIDFVTQMFHESADRFLKVMGTVTNPSEDLHTYLLGLGYWIAASPLVAGNDISVESPAINVQHGPNLLLYPLPDLRGKPFVFYVDNTECVDIPSEVAQNVYSIKILEPILCVFIPEARCRIPWNHMEQLEKITQGDHQEVSDKVRAAKSVRCVKHVFLGLDTLKHMTHLKEPQSLQSNTKEKEINSVSSSEESYMHSFNKAGNYGAASNINIQLWNVGDGTLFAENRPNGQPNGTVTLYTYPNFKGLWKKFRVFSNHCYLQPRKLSNNVKSIVISAKIDSCTFWSERDCKGDPYWLPAGKIEDLKSEGTSFVSFECLLIEEEDPEDPEDRDEDEEL
ncbi:hypothetical protein IFR05_016215 [Cadophora sp. M221]|nr:hypothetical protein IFR05_016215 [Cadophora sp. M221]